jgi:PAS domain S-box-containing protein
MQDEDKTKGQLIVELHELRKRVAESEKDKEERKRAEDALKRIEWMLSKKHSSAMEVQEDGQGQGYGDLTALNRDGVILKSVGRVLLESIAADFLDLLGTSSAIYEVNGAYALGILTSNWCRMLDGASRKLCDTDDNAAALGSGQWLCHESCWTRCSKEAIATRAPADIECNGGIRLYGVPIVAGETVIGSINFGYGDTPKDSAKIRALANAYHLNYEDLLAEADAFDSRPVYIVEMAKSRLHASARLIGMLVERKLAEEALRESETALQERIKELNCLYGISALSELPGITLDEILKRTVMLIPPAWQFPEITAARIVLDGQSFQTENFRETSWMQSSDIVANGKPVGQVEVCYLEERMASKGGPFLIEERSLLNAIAEHLGGIVERKLAEEELGLYRDHLAGLVKERTATLAKVNERLTHEIEVRKKAEQALLESQQMLQSVLDTIPVRVFWKDLDSNYLGCNRPFALDAALQSPEEIVGRNDFEMGWAEQAELYRSDDRFVLKTGSPKLGYEEPQTTPDGRRIWLRTNKVPLLDTEGRIRGVLGTYEDITGSKRMEEALRTSGIKYRIVADNTYDWEYWTSPDGRFLYTSPSCQRVTGYAASEFEMDPELLARIVHPDDLAQFKAHVTQGEASSEPLGLEFRIVHRDGTMRWIGHLCQPVFDAEGFFLGRQPVFDAEGFFLGRRGSNRDITDRKNAEKALQDSSQKLKLFAYSVAHDLKSPAIGIYGLAKRLNKNYKAVLDERGRNYCDQILTASEHIAALVDKVNVYIATKETHLSIESINIAEIYRMLKEEFSARLDKRCIDWLVPETTREIKADRMSMIRAFRNFVDNSLKYGGERLSKIWTGYEESDDFHIFSFSDNGKGLEEKDSEKIFGAFQRNVTSKGIEGVGLGLTIVKEIAEQHGGKVWVEPRTNKGTTFYISISKNL